MLILYMYLQVDVNLVHVIASGIWYMYLQVDINLVHVSAIRC